MFDGGEGKQKFCFMNASLFSMIQKTWSTFENEERGEGVEGLRKEM